VSWALASNRSLVDGSTVPLVYLDGLAIFATAPLNLVIDGEVKKSNVIQVAKAGFNIFGTIYPAGATLSSAFDGALSTIHPGYSGPGNADLIYVPGTGGQLPSYFYDADNASWANASDSSLVAGSSIALPSGILYFNAGADINVKNSAPAYYSSL
jgi:hypothetical protein